MEFLCFQSSLKIILLLVWFVSRTNQIGCSHAQWSKFGDLENTDFISQNLRAVEFLFKGVGDGDKGSYSMVQSR